MEQQILRGYMMVVPINEARDEMANSLINMLDFTITIPLNEATKNIHTNTFIKVYDLFDVPDLWKIYQAMGKTKASRYIDFRKGYWYVSQVDIDYSNNTMKLKLLALPSVPQYDKSDMNAQSSGDKTVDKNNTSGSTKLRGDKYCQQIVKKAIGTLTNKLAMAMKCDEYFKTNHVYTRYNDFHHGKNFKSTWNTKALNCGDGAVCLCNMFYTIGLNPKMLLSPDRAHYFVKVDIDGRTYYCDQSGGEKAHTNRRLSTSSKKSVWNYYSTGSERAWK